MKLLEAFFYASLYGYLLATIAYVAWFFWRDRRLWLVACVVLGLALASQVMFVVARGLAAGRPPFANIFETLVFLAACVAAFSLLTAWLYGWKSMSPPAALACLLVTLVASTLMEEIQPLVPALQNSFWLTVHVVFNMVGYAAFLISYLAALAFLLKDERHAAGASLAVAFNVSGLFAALMVAVAAGSTGWHTGRRAILLGAAGGAILLAAGLWPLMVWGTSRLRLRERLPEAEDLERVTHRMVAFGLPFLTLGIATGAYWANQAWGRYWGWDDKEVAALVTWLVYAIYLHLRRLPSWRGPRAARAAWVAVVGFWCVLFTYFGVNYLLGGQHSHM